MKKNEMRLRQSNLIILRKTPFSETSLVASCLSADLGRVDLLVRGAMRIEKKRFPEIDLFNEINAFFKEAGSGGLHSLSSSEIISSALPMAEHPENLASAFKIARFVLDNTRFNVRAARLYAAIKRLAADFASRTCGVEWETYVRLIYLDEQGFLPSYDKSLEFANFAKLLDAVFAFCEDRSGQHAPPRLSAKYLKRLERWSAEVCAIHSIRVP